MPPEPPIADYFRPSALISLTWRFAGVYLEQENKSNVPPSLEWKRNQTNEWGAPNQKASIQHGGQDDETRYDDRRGCAAARAQPRRRPGAGHHHGGWRPERLDRRHAPG